jgi:hypothetical protein
MYEETGPDGHRRYTVAQALRVRVS